MLRQRHDALFAEPITQVYQALLRTLAFRRWPVACASGEEVPRPGQAYRYQTDTALRTGRVLELIRPVAVSLQETLDDPPCRVLLKLKFRIEPVEAGSLVRLDMRYRLDKAAQLRPRHWHRRLYGHARRTLGFVRAELERQQTTAAASSNSGT